MWLALEFHDNHPVPQPHPSGFPCSSCQSHDYLRLPFTISPSVGGVFLWLADITGCWRPAPASALCSFTCPLVSDLPCPGQLWFSISLVFWLRILQRVHGEMELKGKLLCFNLAMSMFLIWAPGLAWSQPQPLIPTSCQWWLSGTSPMAQVIEFPASHARVTDQALGLTRLSQGCLGIWGVN